MKKIIFIIFWSPLLCFGQNSYNFYLNNAELAIVDSKYRSAVKSYDSAFLIRPPFARDIYNAALCAVKIKDYSLANNYLLKLNYYGFVLDSLKKRPAFLEFVRSSYYKKLLREAKRQPKMRLDSTKILFLAEMLNDDQYFRLKNPHNYNKGEFGTIIRMIDSINSAKFINFIKTHGYPNEIKYGIEDNRLSYAKMNPIIQHQQFGSPGRIFDYSPILLEAIKRNEISQSVGLTLYTLSAGRDSLFGSNGFFSVEQPSGKFKFAYYPLFGKGREEKFNNNRKLYGLESLNDYRKKVIFFIKQKEFQTDISDGVTIQKINKEFVPYYKDLTYIE